MLKNNKAQSGVFGLSFNMIVSIILIVFFVVAAFMGIRAFLGYQQCTSLNMFIDDLQGKIDEAWYAESADYNFTSSLPSGVKYVCFANLSAPAKNANTDEKAIYDEIQKSAIPDYSYNFFVYSPGKEYCVRWKKIKHVDVSEKNPICFKVFSNKAQIQITREYSNPLVKVSY